LYPRFAGRDLHRAPVPETKDLKDLFDNGWIDAETIDQYNAVREQAKTLYPNINLKIRPLEGGKNKDLAVDLIGQVTGETDQFKAQEVKKNNSVVVDGGTQAEQLKQAQDEVKQMRVDNLVRKAFDADREGDLADPIANPWWANRPLEERQEAYRKITDIQSSPEKLAEYVLEQGFENLQSYKWWSGNEGKQAAWDIIKQRQATEGINADTGGSLDTTNLNPGADVDSTASPADGGTGGGTGGATGATGDSDRDAFKKDIEQAIANGQITDWQADLYLQAYDEHQTGDPIDIDSILSKFRDIREKTIDPEFAARTKVFTDDLTKAVQFQNAQRESELETERALAGKTIRQAKEGLEKAGMTFTGQAIEDLGAQSAYAQEDQTPTGGLFHEGTVNQANRLLSSSSLARYNQNLNVLGREAETQLGSGMAGLQNIPGYQVTGGVTGKIPEAQEAASADVFSGLLGVGAQQAQQQEPLKFNL